MEFHSTKANEPLLQAVEIIRGINESGKRKVPDDSPVDFISKRWKKHLYEDDGTTINCHYYEMAVLTELREHVRAGDVSIVGSRQYRDFEEYLFSEDTWNQTKENTRLSVSLSFEDYMTERTSSLNKRLKWLATNSNKLDGVSLEKRKAVNCTIRKRCSRRSKKI
ncbi:hypothetical protein J2S13_000466 [Oikeobacillus pervagus]|uniref:Uncharacterized protein n=1 Tax=Oikeobacillus pervagus TaxID=1325931 RepID=A0AAJ1T2H3_9BACI|nr:hypothetical protein [Oikeobacillus pervagus]